MGLGVLEPRGHLEHVPGTTRYFDDGQSDDNTGAEQAGIPRAALKRDATGTIILVPQPSDDPNDPLNWPLWRRDLITFALSFAAVLATALGSILAANTVTIVRLFRKNFTEVALLTGYYLLGAGAAAIFFVPSARIWGKRHSFLLGLVLVIASSAWGGAVGTSYGSLLGARVVQGIGTAPFESLLNAAVGDLYFVHQRGLRMAFANLAVFGGAFFSPIVVGKITAELSFAWTFWFVVIFAGVTLPIIFLLCPETAYRRDDALNTDINASTELNNLSKDGVSDPAANQPDEHPPRKGFVLFPSSNALQPIGHAGTPKHTFAESISLFNGRKTNDRYWVLLLRPFPLLANPAFIWGCLTQGTMIAWTVLLAVVNAALFIGSPYFWGEVKSGYTYAAPFLGSIIGFIIAGAFSDSSIKYMTRLNKGIYEPEFRIAVLSIWNLVIGGIGLYGFGLTAGEVGGGRYSFYVPITFFAFTVASTIISAVVSSLYIVDAYRDLAVEGLTLMIIFKNILSFILTFFAFDWLIAGGIKDTIVVVASVQVVICLLSIPMYLYGKRLRSFYSRHDLVAMCGLQ
ncbi:MFS-type transporter [Paramyrothecium foliicola]|nr:MFS-type transporter [Paramyrothecium foliicola]